MFRKPIYKRLTELGDGGTRVDDVKERPADNVAKPTDAALRRLLRRRPRPCRAAAAVRL